MIEQKREFKLIAKKNPKTQVLAFDVFEKNCSRLKEMREINNLNNIKIFSLFPKFFKKLTKSFKFSGLKKTFAFPPILNQLVFFKS